MTAIAIASGIFGVLCIAIGLIVGGVGFGILNENEEPILALALGVVALLLVGAGLHFLHLLPW